MPGNTECHQVYVDVLRFVSHIVLKGTECSFVVLFKAINYLLFTRPVLFDKIKSSEVKRTRGKLTENKNDC